MSAECSAENIPPGYKQTEVGIIPEDWNVVILSEITSEIGDGIHATPEYSTTGDYFFINGNNIQNGCVVITKDTKSTSTSEYHKYRKNLSDKTLLLSINGTIGNVALYSEEPIFLGKSAAYLNVHENISRLLVFYLLQTAGVIAYFNEGLTGTTIKNLGLATIRSTPVPLPPTKAEQEAIAEALSDTDAFIESLEQLIAKKRQIKQGAMQELLTGKRRLLGFEKSKGYKQTEGGTIPDDWEILPLEFFLSFISYGFTNPMPTSESGIYMITARDINGGRIRFETARCTTEEAYKTRLTDKSRVKAGDILLTKDGTLGRLALVDGRKVCINQSVAVLKPNSKIDAKFLKVLLEAPNYQSRMLEDAGGSTIKHIYITIVNKMPIAVPSTKAEQKAIASILSDMESETAELEEKLAKARQIKQGMMQELLTGKIRLL